MSNLEDILVPLIVFATFFGMFYVFFTTRNKERMAMIEKGVDAKLFRSGSGKNSYAVVALYLGLLAIGIGIGVVLGNLLEMNGVDEDVAYPAMVFICGGLGLLGGFFSARKFKKDKEDQTED